MATRLVGNEELGYTIFPYCRDTPIQDALLSNPSDYVLGFVTHNKHTGTRSFTYTESGQLTETTHHWSLTILQGFPYCEECGPWIVYSCAPEKVNYEFGRLIRKYHTSLHICGWDTWSMEGKQKKVAVVRSWEMS